ncbi:carboxypeptidase-like regulatory domain-containing protein [Olivibacter sitiensis]|uniref:carboxypeptidase-like regulatory domain-containing protein n=1 Tax=Olivibacter sitiensis TaxID=376470 RepID=UPI00040411E3|nr:carboxypeptidase-like regulatory domain-containing protein [Olivibacter sitiensis]
MKEKLLYLFLFCYMLISTVTAQEKTIAGKVTGGDGLPIPGVSVAIRGAEVATQTDYNGNYKITASTGNVLVFSFIGMQTTEMKVGENAIIDVQLKEDAQALGEVVVTALGLEENEKSLTYATQTIGSSTLNISNEGNLKTALAGKVAGIQVARRQDPNWAIPVLFI